MFRGNINVDEVKLILEGGKIINEYPADKPYPSFLLLGIADLRPLHLLIAKDNETGDCILVMVYEPDRNVWSDDFKTKNR